MSQGFSPVNRQMMAPSTTHMPKTDYVPNFVPQLAPVPPVQLQSFSRSPSAPMYFPVQAVSPGQPLQVPAGYTAVVMNPSPLLLHPMMPGSSNSLPRGSPQLQYTLSGVAQLSETVSPAGPPPMHGGLFISTTTAVTPDWPQMPQTQQVYSQSQSRSLSLVSDVDHLPVNEQERERSPSMGSLPRLSSGPQYYGSACSSRSGSSVSSIRSGSPTEQQIPKRQLIDNCRAHFRNMPIPYDEIGNRGENVVRIKVKTRNALENIVPFVDACNAQGLLTRVSCPISTKKGRQHIRGFLAYLECSDSAAVQQLFAEYNAEFACFKPLDVNPPSKRPYNPAATVGAMGN
jgi:hypothetical protein